MNILLVASHGGHCAELLSLREAWEGHKQLMVVTQGAGNPPGVLEVDPIGEDLWSLLKAFVRFRRIVAEFQPDAVVSTGAEVALPAMFWGRLYGARTLYIECSARVRSASLTGRILSRWVTACWVQWPTALGAFKGRARFHGGTV
ncbi:MAG: hypothetical protein AB7F75_02900 [Planctomycetota bacterium]